MIQLCITPKDVPPPEETAEFPLTVQLFKMDPDAPPPFTYAELRVSMQLFRIHRNAPPPEPEPAAFSVNLQLLRVAPKTAPPLAYAELPVNRQLDTTGLVDGDQRPPPLVCCHVPSALVAPLVNVNPSRVAPLPRYTHRTAFSPLI